MTLIKPIRLNVSEFHILSHDSIMWPSGSWSRNNTWPINTQHHSPHLPLSIIIIAFSQHWLSCQYCQTLEDNNIFFNTHLYSILYNIHTTHSLNQYIDRERSTYPTIKFAIPYCCVLVLVHDGFLVVTGVWGCVITVIILIIVAGEVQSRSCHHGLYVQTALPHYVSP